jgi:hypothetical protein
MYIYFSFINFLNLHTDYTNSLTKTKTKLRKKSTYEEIYKKSVHFRICVSSLHSSALTPNEPRY